MSLNTYCITLFLFLTVCGAIEVFLSRRREKARHRIFDLLKAEHDGYIVTQKDGYTFPTNLPGMEEDDAK